MEIRFLLCSSLTLVFMLALGEAAGDIMRWSRKEMVEMAGYGEDKLSSVLVTASLLSSSSSPIPGKYCKQVAMSRLVHVMVLVSSHFLYIQVLRLASSATLDIERDLNGSKLSQMRWDNSPLIFLPTFMQFLTQTRLVPSNHSLFLNRIIALTPRVTEALNSFPLPTACESTQQETSPYTEVHVNRDFRLMFDIFLYGSFSLIERKRTSLFCI